MPRLWERKVNNNGQWRIGENVELQEMLEEPHQNRCKMEANTIKGQRNLEFPKKYFPRDR